MNFDAARSFVYRNARPIDLARWKFLFENGSREDVLTALAVYQNSDGGFGHGLEADCWNPGSSPVQTWAATEILREIGFEDREHHIVKGILRYLSSGADSDGHTWFNTVPANDDFPHAEWWNFQPVQSLPYNPTACLIGFILKFADPGDKLYAEAQRLAGEAYEYFKREFPTKSVSTATCFVRLYEYLKEAAAGDLIDMEEFRGLLSRQIRETIEYNTDIWSTEYVCKPSQFIESESSDFYAENKEICDAECEFISDTQNGDGTWNITWAWGNYPEEWHIAKNWWKSDRIILNVKFFRNMSR